MLGEHLGGGHQRGEGGEARRRPLEAAELDAAHPVGDEVLDVIGTGCVAVEPAHDSSVVARPLARTRPEADYSSCRSLQGCPHPGAVGTDCEGVVSGIHQWEPPARSGSLPTGAIGGERRALGPHTFSGTTDTHEQAQNGDRPCPRTAYVPTGGVGCLVALDRAVKLAMAGQLAPPASSPNRPASSSLGGAPPSTSRKTPSTTVAPMAHSTPRRTRRTRNCGPRCTAPPCWAACWPRRYIRSDEPPDPAATRPPWKRDGARPTRADRCAESEPARRPRTRRVTGRDGSPPAPARRLRRGTRYRGPRTVGPRHPEGAGRDGRPDAGTGLRPTGPPRRPAATTAPAPAGRHCGRPRGRSRARVHRRPVTPAPQAVRLFPFCPAGLVLA